MGIHKRTRRLNTLQKMVAKAKKLFKKKKIDSFKEFAESMTFRSNAKYTWNRSKVLKNKWANLNPMHVTENLQFDNQITVSLNKISPPWVPTDPNYYPESNSNKFFDAPFTLTEFNLALNSRNSKSAPGLDGVDYDIIKNLPFNYKLILIDIYNEMFTMGDFPVEWKQSYIHFIKKSDGKSVRPFALSSCYCKLFEALIKNRLQWCLEHNNLLQTRQTGFRKGLSCIDNLTNLTLYIEDGFIKKKNTIAAFLDIQSAFDNVNSDILIDKLSSMQCSTMLIRFVKFLTYEREIYTENSKRARLVYKGVPQGGVLSPLLFILYISDISNNLPKSISVSQFADDFAIYSKISPLPKCIKLIEKAIKTIRNNLLSLGLDLCPHKTTLIHFNKKNITPGQTEIKINNLSIKSSESTRFLGIKFDYKMSFSPHLQHVQDKCMKALNIIKFLCGTWWGSEPETLITLYKSLVRSHIDYGIFIYYPTQKKLKEKFEKIQFSAIRSALGYRISTPTNVLLAESKLPLINDRAVFLCNYFLTRSLSNTSIQTNKEIIHYYSRNKTDKRKRKRLIVQCILKYLNEGKHNNLYIDNQFSIYRFDYTTITTSITINTEIGTSLKYIENPNIKLGNYLFKEDTLKIYTDGSKIEGAASVGVSCICRELNISIKKSVSSTASVFTAECIALNIVLDITLLNTDHSIKILSDSLSTLLCLQHPRIDVKTNFYILEAKEKYNKFIQRSTNRNKIELIWIPSHIGLQGNDTADILAKAATMEQPDNNMVIPMTDFRETFKRSSSLNTSDYIVKQGEVKGKEYFRYHYRSVCKPWFTNKGLPRAFITTVNRCRSNHYNLAASLFHVGITNSPNCECNAECRDLNHVIWQCPLYDNQRADLLERMYKNILYPPFNVRPLLSEPNIVACMNIYNFLKKCNLQI